MDKDEFKLTETSVSSNGDSNEAPKDVYFSNIESGDANNKEDEMPVKKVSSTASVKKTKPKKPKGQSVIGTYMFFVIVIVVSMALSIYAVFCLNDVLAITKSSSSVTVNVTDQITTTQDAVDLLADNGLIKCENFCKLFAKYREEYVGAPYEPGIYYLNAKMGLEGMLQTMHGDSTTAETVTITFPEGYSTVEIVDKLVANEVCDKASLLSSIETVDFDYPLVKDLESKEYVPYRLEGYMFPDTYEFFVGESATSVVKKFLSNGDSKISENYRNRAKEMGYSMHEIIIIASIIQAEAGSDEQMKEISAVIHNRLNDKSQFPQLGCDSTSDYIKNKVGPALSSTSGHTVGYYLKYYSTANTSTVSGLPAGPICNPGMSAIDAALYPANSDACYFFHDNDGVLYTATSYNEFQQKINTYAPYLN